MYQIAYSSTETAGVRYIWSSLINFAVLFLKVFDGRASSRCVAAVYSLATFPPAYEGFCPHTATVA